MTDSRQYSGTGSALTAPMPAIFATTIGDYINRRSCSRQAKLAFDDQTIARHSLLWPDDGRPGYLPQRHWSFVRGAMGKSPL